MADPVYRRGLIITGLGVLILIPDALLLKLVVADPATVLLYRGLGFGIIGISWHVWRAPQGWRCVTVIRRPKGALCVALYAVGGACFPLAILFAPVANVLVIIAIVPLLAALFSRVLLKERLPLRVWAASIAALIGVAIIMRAGLRAEGSLGHLFALGTAVCMSLNFVTVRSAPSLNLNPAIAIGALITGLAAAPFAAPLSLSASSQFYLILNSALVVPLALSLILTGPRYLPAPEVGLLMLLETVLSPVLVYSVLGERPSESALLGGVIVIGALALNAVLGLYARPGTGRTPAQQGA